MFFIFMAPISLLHYFMVFVCRFQISKSQICMVGDRLDTDILFGQNGGCKTLLVLSGNMETTVFSFAFPSIGCVCILCLKFKHFRCPMLGSPIFFITSLA